MATKLTLTVQKDVIELAKAYASKKGRSLSEIIESYLRTLVRGEKSESELSPGVKKLLGSVKAPKDFEYEAELENELHKKHSR